MRPQDLSQDGFKIYKDTATDKLVAYKSTGKGAETTAQDDYLSDHTLDNFGDEQGWVYWEAETGEREDDEGIWAQAIPASYEANDLELIPLKTKNIANTTNATDDSFAVKELSSLTTSDPTKFQHIWNLGSGGEPGIVVAAPNHEGHQNFFVPSGSGTVVGQIVSYSPITGAVTFNKITDNQTTKTVWNAVAKYNGKAGIPLSTEVVVGQYAVFFRTGTGNNTNLTGFQGTDPGTSTGASYVFFCSEKESECVCPTRITWYSLGYASNYPYVIGQNDSNIYPSKSDATNPHTTNLECFTNLYSYTATSSWYVPEQTISGTYINYWVRFYDNFNDTYYQFSSPYGNVIKNNFCNTSAGIISFRVPGTNVPDKKFLCHGFHPYDACTTQKFCRYISLDRLFSSYTDASLPEKIDVYSQWLLQDFDDARGQDLVSGVGSFPYVALTSAYDGLNEEADAYLFAFTVLVSANVPGVTTHASANIPGWTDSNGNPISAYAYVEDNNTLDFGDLPTRYGGKLKTSRTPGDWWFYDGNDSTWKHSTSTSFTFSGRYRFGDTWDARYRATTVNSGTAILVST